MVFRIVFDDHKGHDATIKCILHRRETALYINEHFYF